MKEVFIFVLSAYESVVKFSEEILLVLQHMCMFVTHVLL